MLRFAYSTINWGEWCDLHAACAEIASAGWRAVELFGHALDWLGPPEHLRGALGDLRVATFFGAIELPASPRHLTIHRRRIDYAAVVGAEAYGLVGANRPRAHPPTPDDIAALADACEALACYAQDRGVQVAYHPHTRCTIENEAEIDALMNETQTLALCLDVSHIALVGEDPLAHLRKYRERLGYVHLKDWARGEFVEMGQGTLGIDFAACLAELEQQDFRGWCVVEHSVSKTSPLDSAKVNATYLRRLGYEL